MKKTAKRLTALALSAAMLTAPAGAITADGQSETWFDGVWSLIDAFSIKTEHDPYVLQNYINKYLEKHPEEMYDVINDILGLLDTHSMYLSSEEYSQGFSTLEGFVGIGVKIDGEDVSGAETADVASRLRGQEGTTVSVTVRRQGRDITVSITRRQINQVYVSNSTLTQGVEYIKISSFASENDWQAFSEIWNGLAKRNTRAVVLDLRGNGGGLIDVAFKIANAMTPDTGVTLAGVRYRDDMGGLDETVSTGGGLPLNKIVVLVNGGTASAAELLTGILQDTAENVTVVGEKTYGKGQGQMHLPLINGDKLVITTLEMELPGQGCWEGRGLTPDIQVGNSTVSVREDALHALDTSRTMCFGEVSDNIYAMTERLQLLGLIGEPTNTFNGDVLDAVTGFCSSYDLPAAACASPEMLSALSDAISALSGKTYTLDMQMQSALEICRLAAAKPQQYTVSPDGTWKRNS